LCKAVEVSRDALRGVAVVRSRDQGVSTSDLILRILSRYDDYVMRQLQRGMTAEQLNLSVFKVGWDACTDGAEG
jgi:hypothetical protein